MKSPFLFDDREIFYYGNFVTQEVSYLDQSLIEGLRQLRHQAMSYFIAVATIASVGSAVYVNEAMASTQAHISIKSRAKIAEENESELRHSFLKNREFLGLKQNQVATILGLSESTIEKFEQGVYSSMATKTKEMISLFNEWAFVLKQFHGDRKFIVRPLIKAKINSLGDQSALEYAMSNPGEGLHDLIGLERKMYG